MRLEVRRDNPASLSLFRRHGYRQFKEVLDYYEDHMDALRFEKRLVPYLQAELVKVPYYQQTLDFTCGPAALMMAMKALDPALELNRTLELRLWREATTIFMTSGHGGCGPYGLALSAYRRGFDLEIHVNEDGVFLVDSVRSLEKKEVMRLVQEDWIEELRHLPVALHRGSLGVDELRQKFEAGGIPLVLISSYRIYGERFPHWVVVTGFDEHYIYVHDPLVDTEEGETLADSVNMPIPHREFQRMARYGKAGQKAVLILPFPAGRNRRHHHCLKRISTVSGAPSPTDGRSHYPGGKSHRLESALSQPARRRGQGLSGKPEYSSAGRNLRVLNLCRSYRYLSVGYYCSLLAEARRHRVIPSVRTLNDLSRKSIYSLDIEDLDDQVQQVLGKPRPGFTATAFELDIFFGQCSVRNAGTGPATVRRLPRAAAAGGIPPAGPMAHRHPQGAAPAFAVARTGRDVHGRADHVPQPALAATAGAQQLPLRSGDAAQPQGGPAALQPQGPATFHQDRPRVRRQRRIDREEGLWPAGRIRRAVYPRNHRHRPLHLPVRQKGGKRRDGGDR